MLIGFVANGLNSGEFCAGSRIVLSHQHINDTSFVFSAAVPAFLIVSASEGTNILQDTPFILSTLQENMRSARAVLDHIDSVTIPSHVASPIIHIYLRTATPSISAAAAKAPNPGAAASPDVPSFDLRARSSSCRTLWTKVLAQGVWIKGLGDCVGRSSLNRGRAFASL